MLVVIHGGAGVIKPEQLTAERREQRLAGLDRALRHGWQALAQGGSALDACCAAVCELEDTPYFNAGRGSTFHLERGLEMEASVMQGHDRSCGAVTGLWGPRHPVLAARRVMEQTPHIFMGGEGAAKFCRAQGLEEMPQDWFVNPDRLKALEESLQQQQLANGCGTVGAVALDAAGQLAAATSTGGRNAKMFGRIGDTPCIGAGTWADNQTCAVSGTGYGESFIRFATAHEIHARMRWGGQSLQQACAETVAEMGQQGGLGGVIALDRQANFCMPFNCLGMYRGYMTDGTTTHLAILNEEFEQRSATGAA